MSIVLILPFSCELRSRYSIPATRFTDLPNPCVILACVIKHSMPAHSIISIAAIRNRIFTRFNTSKKKMFSSSSVCLLAASSNFSNLSYEFLVLSLCWEEGEELSAWRSNSRKWLKQAQMWPCEGTCARSDGYMKK